MTRQWTIFQLELTNGTSDIIEETYTRSVFLETKSKQNTPTLLFSVAAKAEMAMDIQSPMVRWKETVLQWANCRSLTL